MSAPSTVLISTTEYKELKKDQEKLRGLEHGGVDNWEWYSESLTEWFKKYASD